jgi:hypothetical protein
MFASICASQQEIVEHLFFSHVLWLSLFEKYFSFLKNYPKKNKNHSFGENYFTSLNYNYNYIHSTNFKVGLLPKTETVGKSKKLYFHF